MLTLTYKRQKMKKLSVWRNKYSGLIIAVLLACGIGGVAHAISGNTTVIVQIGPVIIDVCPNILGVQATVPGGMIIDGNGDCVTPPPPVVDVCNNIAGTQNTIPAGYYQDGNGDCLVQPSPPVDVCPNLFGVQAVVPSSLIVDENGNCIAPPIDECPNIEGPQSAIPEGMVKVDSICFTPTPEVPTTTDPEDNTPTGNSNNQTPPRNTPDYKNVPAALDAVFEPLVNLVPPALKEAVKNVPVSVARTVPYYIYAILALAAAIMVIQAFRELSATRALVFLLKKEQDIAEQKDNFIALASHYLRTPLTLMRNGLDTILALKEMSATQLAPLRTTITSLDANIKAVLADIDTNEALKGISAPPTGFDEKRSLIGSLLFWGPILGAVILTGSANFLLGVVADVELGTANLLFQVVVFVAVTIVFYSAFRNFRIRRQQRSYQQKLIEHERTIDAARNGFIQRSTEVLQTGLAAIYSQRSTLGTTPSARFFDEGYLRFNNILEKFLLLGQIQADSVEDIETINLRETIDTVLSAVQPIIMTKKIKVQNDVDGLIFIKQNRALFEFVIHSVVDNAIKFNAEGGTITIAADRDKKQIIVNISDTGIGIPKDKLAQLFKPFSRADSALQFNYEGLGFSLFLDKIITDYMGGDIVATSSKDKGTNITVKTALAHN